MSPLDAEQPIEPSAVEEYTAALLRGVFELPEEWISARDPTAPPNSQAVAVLRSVDLLVRHRDALAQRMLAGGTGAGLVRGTSRIAPTMSPLVADEAELTDSLMNDRQWLAAHNLEPIGSLDVPGGGMGSIGLAWHTEMKREVVLKVARGESNELRFRREVQVHAKLGGHSNIAVTRTPLRYRNASVLVVDYVPGLSLRQRVQLVGPMDWRESCDCVRQAAIGLSHAHHLGVMHRDVKSSNLLRSSRDGVVKVIDWGLALDRETPEQALTLSGQYLGTPAYCAPEQGRKPSDATAASDLYGLGCVWYELLTGSPPFQGDRAELVAAHDHEPVPRLPARLGVPEPVELVLRTLLEKMPERRFASADEFIAALDLAATGRPVDRRFWLAVVATGSILTVLALTVRRESPKRAVPPSSLELAVTELVIELSDTSNSPQRSGKLGETTYDARQGDQVTLWAELSRVAYCYLLSFRPDGQMEVWWPSDVNQRPALEASPRYPAGNSAAAISLNHGRGLQAFALVASLEPLPDFRTWQARQGRPPWRASIPADPGIIWCDDGRRIETLSALGKNANRGTGVAARGARGAVAELSEWLKSRPGVSLAYLKAFGVQ
jgi:serine/threonine protein kinase